MVAGTGHHAVFASLRLRQLGNSASSGCSSVPLQPWFMLPWPSSKVFCSSGVEIQRRPAHRELVLPPGCSSKVKIEQHSIGHCGAIGWRVEPAVLVRERVDEDDTLRRDDLAIDHPAPMSWPSVVRMP